MKKDTGKKSKLSLSDQRYVINTVVLEVAIAENSSVDAYYVGYNEVTKEWRIVRTADRIVKFKKTF